MNSNNGMQFSNLYKDKAEWMLEFCIELISATC